MYVQLIFANTKLSLHLEYWWIEPIILKIKSNINETRFYFNGSIFQRDALWFLSRLYRLRDNSLFNVT